MWNTEKLCSLRSDDGLTYSVYIPAGLFKKEARVGVHLSKEGVKLQKALMKLQGVQQMKEGMFDSEHESVFFHGKKYSIKDLFLDIPISGTVYGTLLNYQGAYHSMAARMHDDPYKTPPRAPILYIKPVNTFTAASFPIPLPAGHHELVTGASLGIVIGKTAAKVKERAALDCVMGYTIVNDISIPHGSVYRPAVKQKARDGFCPIGPWIIEKSSVPDPDALTIRVFVNGELKQENNTANLIRPVHRLIADVTDFMTLFAGDVLLTGVPENPPLVRENDLVQIEIEGIGMLENRVVKEHAVAGGSV